MRKSAAAENFSSEMTNAKPLYAYDQRNWRWPNRIMSRSFASEIKNSEFFSSFTVGARVFKIYPEGKSRSRVSFEMEDSVGAMLAANCFHLSCAAEVNAMANPNPNAPCPCGSNKPYKDCCGKGK